MQGRHSPMPWEAEQHGDGNGSHQHTSSKVSQTPVSGLRQADLQHHPDKN